MIHKILEKSEKYKNVLIPNPLENLFISTTSVCNLKCAFCVHKKLSQQKTIMSKTDFESFIDKATDFGYESFNLTPNTGEPTIDPLFPDRLNFLERHNKVYDYYFSTNLTLANDFFLKTLTDLKKLRCLSISIYGHSAQSFTTITAGSLELYRKIIDNLKLLLEYNTLTTKVELKIRTIQQFDLNTCNSELCSILKIARKQGIRIRIKSQYSNWGGQITDRELEQIGLKLKKKPHDRKEPCVFIFFNPALLTNGSINACACADGMANLVLGNLKNTNFRKIYSVHNNFYMKLLYRHLAGTFDGICQKCSEYRPISADWYAYAFHRKKMITVSKFIEWLSNT